MEFVLTSSSGLFALLLIGIIVSIPYATRWLRRHFGPDKLNYLAGIAAHQWCGYALLIIAVVHMYASMGGGLAMRVNPLGVNAATLALLLLLAQLALGQSRPLAEAGAARLVWRRIHFVVMLGIVGLVGVHVWLNGMLIYRFL